MNKYKSLLTIIMAALLVLCSAAGMGCSTISATDADDPDGDETRMTVSAYTDTPIPLSNETEVPNVNVPDAAPTNELIDLPTYPIDAPGAAQTSEPTPEATEEPVIDVIEAPLPTLSAEPSPTEEPIADVNYVPGYINEVFVNFRNGPSTEAEIIRVCREGTKLFITGKTSEWYRVEINKQEGYIARPYITIGYLPTPAPTATPKPSSPPSPTTPPNPPMYTVEPGQFTDQEIQLVAALVHVEGNGSTYVGCRAIASIVLNRVLNKSGRFPDTVSGVLFQSGQFGYSKSYLESITPNSTAMAAAQYVFSTHGSTLPKKVLFYRATSLGKTWYSYTRYYATIEGNCYFYGINFF